MLLEYMTLKSKWLLAGGVLLFLSACTIRDFFEKPDSPEHLVRVLFSSGGLGDLSFNDGILRGILEEKEKTCFRLYYTSPADMVQAEQIIRQWQEEDNPESCYTILVGSEYAELIHRLRFDEFRSNWLILDTSEREMNITALRYYGFGVSFLTGMAVRLYTHADTVAFVGGQNLDFIEECRNGFQDGFIHAGGREVLSSYLSDTPEGFASADKAYRLADSLYQKYTFIYAVAGGSNNGIYEYLRKNPNVGGYTNGVDVDQSDYSDRILGSVVKNIGECAGEYIREWVQGNPITEYKVYGLQSGNIGFLAAERYKSSLEHIVRDSFSVAVNKELEYYGKKE